MEKGRAEPLTESYFYILLCLYRGPLHGYGIMQQAARLSDGWVRIGSGTMYGAVSSMMKKGWIAELPNPEDSRKKLYRLTGAGQEVFEGELMRLRKMLGTAERYLKLQEDER